MSQYLLNKEKKIKNESEILTLLKKRIGGTLNVV